MTTPTIATATVADRETILATLTSAFETDPAIRWMYPDPQAYHECFPRLIEVTSGAAFEQGTGVYTEDYAGAALWLAPGVAPDEKAVVAFLEESIPERRQPEIFTLLEQMQERHPDDPVWYLPFVGVEPRQQNNGHGAALLEHTLRQADQDGYPAYLEASSEGNRRLYERHGFEVIGVIQAGDGPPVWPMLREPRQEG